MVMASHTVWDLPGSREEDWGVRGIVGMVVTSALNLMSLEPILTL
jgi:hypothetical protein